MYGAVSGPNSCTVLRPWSICAVQVAVPADPRLVKIWMTPPAASVPYKAVAAGPFTTSMRSMSLGLMSFNGPMTSLGPKAVC